MDKKKMVIDILKDYPQLQVDIVNRLKAEGMPMCTRELRTVLNEINKDFINGKIDFVVISNREGTYKSNSIDDIRKFNQAKISHAKSELWSAYNINKRLSNRNQMTIFEFIEEVMNERA